MKFKYVLFSISFLFYFLGFSQEEEKKENPFFFKWDNGFKLESADKDFKLKFGGRIMVDHAYLFQNDELDTNFGPLVTKSGTEFRRARLFLSGTVYDNVEFKFQIDFAGGDVAFKDMYIGLKALPGVGTVRVGHVKEPFGLQTLNSSKYITFMERSLLSDFSQGRNNGILLFNDFFGKRLSAQAGAFRMAQGNGNDIFADDGYALTGRITGLALQNPDKKQLLHLGVGYSFRKPESKTYKVSSRPEAHLAPKYINTEELEDVDNISLIDFETALVSGPISLQGEYLTTTVYNTDSAPFEKYNFKSFYGQVSYFITGESKSYKGSYEGFDRVKPKRNFGGKDKGTGAWEIALRYSNSDLDSRDVLGGQQTDITLGLNWYLNPAARLMLNHVWPTIKDTGRANILQGRLQIDF
jgi:phosphate-selective porin OprO/OprP